VPGRETLKQATGASCGTARGRIARPRGGPGRLLPGDEGRDPGGVTTSHILCPRGHTTPLSCDCQPLFADV
jgi:hypothetical protein